MAHITKIEEFKCTKCYTSFPRNEEYFYKLKTGKDGLHSQCKKCIIEKTRKSQSNKDYTVYRKERYRKNKKKEDSLKREWIKNNQDRHEKSQKNWRNNNKDKLKEYRLHREMYKTHTIPNGEWEECKKYFDYTCAYCGISEDDAKKAYGNVLHREHVEHDGANDLSNCIPSCKSCNSSKHTEDMEIWYKSKELIFNDKRLLKLTNWLKDDYKKYINNSK